MSEVPDRKRLREEMIVQVVARGTGQSICPSEVARAFGPDWRDLMEAVRGVAVELRDDGVLEITQRGVPITDETWRGPVRLLHKP